eukprot:CAMPEP_0170177834 /NCGR_PEP_ID=MMETSP0040_2-20121228/11156_1 /TAXON_ID=641309 /ORGANISM="Lotharella oceanica, Strain CCMP622" /LENGTH=182 /DNA_ID=CAMNT_0010420647 /DNA_START=50 /DNA_END=596 /DNA_ORIENTATION=+
MDVKAVSANLPAEPVPMQFDIIVFHRESDITVVAILPRNGTMLQSSNNEASSSLAAMDFQRLLAAFMGGMLSRLPNEAQEFWERAMDPQAATRPTPASQKAIDALPTDQIKPLERILVDGVPCVKRITKLVTKSPTSHVTIVSTEIVWCNGFIIETPARSVDTKSKKNKKAKKLQTEQKVLW